MSDLFQAYRFADRPGIWHLVTGEYPPDLGGVTDYSVRLSPVHSPIPRLGCMSGEPGTSQAHPHRWAGLGSTGSPVGLVCMERSLDHFPGPRTILIQYVPHAFGWKAMNLPFVAWVLIRRVRRRDHVRVMFHEVACPWVRRPMRHNVLAAVHRVMAAVMLRACTRAYVAIPGWVPLLRRLGAGRVPIAWTPVPSDVPGEASTPAVAARRAELTRGHPTAQVACHFGTYGPSVTRDLGPVLRELLSRRPDIRALLLGAGGSGGGANWPAEGRTGTPASSPPVRCPPP